MRTRDAEGGLSKTNLKIAPNPDTQMATKEAKRGQGVANLVALDLLRGLAAFEVFLSHVRGGSFVEYGALPASEQTHFVAGFFFLSRLGDEAVMVFFVLSGFLVGGQIVRHVQEKRFNLTSYTIDRLTRILVPLVPACLLTGGVIWYLDGHWPPVLDVLLNMVGLGGLMVDTPRYNLPLWTITYEIWFYVIGGALGYLFCGGRSPVGFCIFILGLGLFMQLGPQYLLFWAIGALTVLLLPVRQKKLFFVGGALVAAFGVISYELGSGTKSFVNVNLLSPNVSNFLVCAGTALTLPLLADQKTNEWLRVLGPFAAFLSTISYSLYLFHYPLNSVVEKFLPQAPELNSVSLMDFALRVIVILIAVYALYWCFEFRTHNLRAWLRSRYPRSQRSNADRYSTAADLGEISHPTVTKHG